MFDVVGMKKDFVQKPGVWKQGFNGEECYSDGEPCCSRGGSRGVDTPGCNLSRLVLR